MTVKIPMWVTEVKSEINGTIIASCHEAQPVPGRLPMSFFYVSSRIEKGFIPKLGDEIIVSISTANAPKI